jgi:hypothetical protein
MYEIVCLPPESRLDTEQLGSKPKFWVQLGADRWLFKEARTNTGEDWAEKAAAEIAREIGVVSAEVQLAQFGDRRGSISRNFIAVDQGEALVHGNEILALRVTGYDKSKRFRQQDHTLENIRQAMRELFPEDVAHGMLTQLASYLVLDGLIGNTDRHHENWGLRVRVVAKDEAVQLSVAPSFDHASSLGRELLDSRREELLAAGKVAHYVSQGRGGVFREADQPHGESPLRLVQEAARAYPSYFCPALERVAGLHDDLVHGVFASIPPARASSLAREFAAQMVLYAKASLSNILK